jgi:thiol-disulfide isomerase/thioredoxin
MKLKFCFLLLLCLFFRANAQNRSLSVKPVSAVLKPLNTGEKLPDIVLEKVLNNNGHSLRTADFRGKLVILDFWATSCSACIRAMPRLDSLQRLFADRLIILPVTAERIHRVKAFQKVNKFLQYPKFLTVVEDRSLHALFPHRLLPHDIWIDSNGKVLGATEVTDINAANIRDVLAGKGLAAQHKADVLDYDRDKPLLIHHNGGPDTAYRFRSVITAELKGLPAGISIRYDSLRNYTTIRATNVSVRRLYNLAFKDLRTVPDSLVDLGTVQGLYCYELFLPGRASAGIRKGIRDDLDRFFRVRSEFTGSAFKLWPREISSANDEPLNL